MGRPVPEEIVACAERPGAAPAAWWEGGVVAG
jgi:hypothetical protein